MPMLKSPNKTVDWRDLEEPPVRKVRRALRKFLWKEFTLRGRAVAVNGVNRRRWYVRRLKMWEYARGLAALPPQSGQRILDFGGGGTLPPFFAAALGAEVHVVDIDRQLSGYSTEIAEQCNWPLQAQDINLADPKTDLPAGWVGAFDRIYSFCVLEHIPYAGQRQSLTQLAKALRVGGGMVLTFEFGADSPGEAPWRDQVRLDEMLSVMAEHGVFPISPAHFEDNGQRFFLDKRHSESKFTFGMLVLEKTLPKA